MLADIVKKARGRMSQRAYARKLGVSYGTVQLWEKGQTIPEAQNLERIAESAEMSLAELMQKIYGENDKPSTQTAEAAASYDLSGKTTADKYLEEMQRLLAERLRTVDSVIERLSLLPNSTFPSIAGDNGMAPMIKKGESIRLNALDTPLNLITPGVYEFSINGRLSIARMHPLPGHKIQVTYDNPSYQSFEVDSLNPPSDFKVNGKVVWVGHNLED